MRALYCPIRIQLLPFSFLLFFLQIPQSEPVSRVGEIMPVQIRFERTVEIRRPDGSTELVHRDWLYHARSSSGAVFQRTETRNPETNEYEPSELLTIEDPETQTAITVHHERKTVILQRLRKDPDKAFAKRTYTDSLERQSLLERTCLVLKNRLGRGELWLEQRRRR